MFLNSYTDLFYSTVNPDIRFYWQITSLISYNFCVWFWNTTVSGQTPFILDTTIEVDQWSDHPSWQHFFVSGVRLFNIQECWSSLQFGIMTSLVMTPLVVTPLVMTSLVMDFLHGKYLPDLTQRVPVDWWCMYFYHLAGQVTWLFSELTYLWHEWGNLQSRWCFFKLERWRITSLCSTRVVIIFGLVFGTSRPLP